MKIVRRFVKDELGATMVLAIMMIVIFGIMGAGLLTFVSRDLNSVIENNRGQRALELADAGVAAAKSQLTSSCTGNTDCKLLYDGGADDIQWSADPAQGGMTLTGLDGSATAPNEVNVAIVYRGDATRDFKVVSTGRYGVATRKVEAILEGVVAFGGGAGGYPLYYTPSDIKIEATTANPVLLRDISVFAGGDILLQGLNRAGFITEMGGNNGDGILTSTGKSDSLQDWCTTVACNTKAFQRIPSNWNTQERKENKTVYAKHKSTDDLLEPGLAAAGRICGFGSPTNVGPALGKCPTSPSIAPSIADGVYGYDCSTGPIPVSETGWKGCPVAQEPRGNQKTFVDKDPEDKNPNAANTITFPFPRPEPIPETLHQNAHATYTCTANPCSPPWDTLIGGRSDIVFIDANKSTVNYNAGNNSGILVVWCGHLQQQSKFQGVIMNLNGKFSNGDGSSFGGSSCTDTTTGGPDMTQGTFRNQGQTFSGWLYAEGGTDTKAGIEIAPGSQIEKFPGGKWSFETEALANVPPNAFVVQGWRELYQ